jgi:hypothetical protein
MLKRVPTTLAKVLFAVVPRPGVRVVEADPRPGPESPPVEPYGRSDGSEAWLATEGEGEE